ncbi:AAA family ATPase [Ensifer sp. ENS06]|uniref:AAA family ATPase n=1 Tax=Ensifer sp. ENS06 TaxID=2769276 RepID=UPI001785C129|nr:AAA family ATPase [Ensifer sp. ENS06]MBD9627994.1 AAA family ATPase [Ensifer sp. ENS06]
MIFVAGLSKSGKTRTLHAAVDGMSDVQHVIASDLLKSAGKTLQPEGLNQVHENQRILLDLLLSIDLDAEQEAIIDGHFIIETGNDAVDVPEWFFERLRPAAIVVVDDPSAAFLARRRGTRFADAPDAVATLRARELDRAEQIAHLLGVPLVSIRSGEIAAMRSAIERFRKAKASH